MCGSKSKLVQLWLNQRVSDDHQKNDAICQVLSQQQLGWAQHIVWIENLLGKSAIPFLASAARQDHLKGWFESVETNNDFFCIKHGALGLGRLGTVFFFINSSGDARLHLNEYHIHDGSASPAESPAVSPLSVPVSTSG